MEISCEHANFGGLGTEQGPTSGLRNCFWMHLFGLQSAMRAPFISLLLYADRQHLFCDTCMASPTVSLAFDIYTVLFLAIRDY